MHDSSQWPKQWSIFPPTDIIGTLFLQWHQRWGIIPLNIWPKLYQLWGTILPTVTNDGGLYSYHLHQWWGSILSTDTNKGVPMPPIWLQQWGTIPPTSTNNGGHYSSHWHQRWSSTIPTDTNKGALFLPYDANKIRRRRVEHVPL